MTAQIGIYHLDAMDGHVVVSSTIDWRSRYQMDGSLPRHAILIGERTDASLPIHPIEYHAGPLKPIDLACYAYPRMFTGRHICV